MRQNIFLDFGTETREIKADVKGGLGIHKAAIRESGTYPWKITHISTGRSVNKMLLRTRKDAFRLRDALLEVCDWNKIKKPSVSEQLKKKILKVFEEFEL